MSRLNKTIQLTQVIDDCVQLTTKAGQLIRHANKTMSSFSESPGKADSSESLMMITDLQIRANAIHNLRQLYPRAQVICQGEETKSWLDYSPSANIEPDQLVKKRKDMRVLTYQTLSQNARSRQAMTQKYKHELEDNFGEEHANEVTPGKFENDVAEEDVAFWIDPVDGSKGLSEGHTCHVTSLIGVTVRGRPKFGIVHKPYSSGSSQGRTYVGNVDSGLFLYEHMFTGDDVINSEAAYIPPFSTCEMMNVKAKDYKSTICGPINPLQRELSDHILCSLDPQQINRVAGAGNKFIQLTEERSDFYLNFIPGYKTWDMAASEAIFASRLGFISNGKGQPLKYDSTGKKFTLWDGIIASKSVQGYNINQSRFQTKTGQSFGEAQMKIRRECHRQKTVNQRSHTEMPIATQHNQQDSAFAVPLQ